MFKKAKLFYLVMIIINVSIIGLFAINTVSAGWVKDVFTPGGPVSFTPQVTLPGSGFTAKTATTLTSANTRPIAKYIKGIYNYGLSIVAILATVMLMAGGYLWAMSGGDASKITQAKEIITGAIVGMLILLGSVTLLGRINKDLVDFKINDVGMIRKIEAGSCCEYTKNGKKITAGISKEECKENGGKYLAKALKVFNKQGESICSQFGCCLLMDKDYLSKNDYTSENMTYYTCSNQINLGFEKTKFHANATARDDGDCEDIVEVQGQIGLVYSLRFDK